MDSPVLADGAGEAQRFNKVSVRAWLRGIINVRRRRGMLPGTGKVAGGKPMLAQSTSRVRGPGSGFVSGQVAQGSTVTEDRFMVSVIAPLSAGVANGVAPFDGIVIGRNNL